MKTCLILGATGFMGKPLCKSICQEYKIIALGRHLPKELEDIKNFTFINREFSTICDFKPILQGVDKVIHLISTTTPTDDTSIIIDEISKNVIPTIRLLEDMVKCGVNEIIFASSGGTVYGETGEKENFVNDKLTPQCSYGVQKKVIEGYLEFYGKFYGLNYKIMRITNPYGVGQDINKPQGVIPIFIHRLIADEPIMVLGNGTSVRDYIYMDDLITAFKKVLDYNGKEHIFNIGSGCVHSLNEVIDIIQDTSGKNFKDIVYKEKRKCDVESSLLNVESSFKELFWVPKTDLKKGIRHIIEWIMEDKG
ncbi:MAG: NAD-dependent epimerase/dehydratase family protein [Lachnospiraceae bacterium]|nr:NAD-dependent epimerase/dehydratase family protein [Lachnospiraceae bacterium]